MIGGMFWKEFNPRMFASIRPDAQMWFGIILAVLFMVSILFSATRLPAITMVNATGSFQQTQKGAIYEAIINIAHPDFREQLIADAEKMHIWRRSNKK